MNNNKWIRFQTTENSSVFICEWCKVFATAVSFSSEASVLNSISEKCFSSLFPVTVGTMPSWCVSAGRSRMTRGCADSEQVVCVSSRVCGGIEVFLLHWLPRRHIALIFEVFANSWDGCHGFIFPPETMATRWSLQDWIWNSSCSYCRPRSLQSVDKQEVERVQIVSDSW